MASFVGSLRALALSPDHVLAPALLVFASLPIVFAGVPSSFFLFLSPPQPFFSPLVQLLLFASRFGSEGHNSIDNGAVQQGEQTVSKGVDRIPNG
jgi:hypothetical protein